MEMKQGTEAVALLRAGAIIDTMPTILASVRAFSGFLLFALASALSAQDSQPQPKPEGLDAFTFSGTTLGGRKLDRDDLANNLVLVDLWGTWCPPCRQAIPTLVKLHQKYKQRGLEIVGFCYSARGGADDADAVRTFAAENRIAYELLLGEAAVRDQVPGFRGYPTMLLFDRGWKHVATHVGWSDATAKELEDWIAKSIDGQSTETAGGESGAKDAEEEDEKEPEEEVPAGRWFQPGKNDRGVDLEFVDVLGQQGSLTGLAGKPVLLALTTTWDREAERTARMLQALHAELGGIQVLAWHLERPTEAEAKNDAVRAFSKRLGVGYRAFSTDLKVAREKVHKFASLPTLLLFDAQGVLVAREGGISEEVEKRIRAKCAELTSAK